jgi:hypothetical protein
MTVALPGIGWPATGRNHPVNATAGRVIAAGAAAADSRAEWHAAQEWVWVRECECSRRFASGSCAVTNAARTTNRSRREPSRLRHPLSVIVTCGTTLQP